MNIKLVVVFDWYDMIWLLIVIFKFVLFFCSMFDAYLYMPMSMWFFYLNFVHQPTWRWFFVLCLFVFRKFRSPSPLFQGIYVVATQIFVHFHPYLGRWSSWVFVNSWMRSMDWGRSVVPDTWKLKRLQDVSWRVNTHTLGKKKNKNTPKKGVASF